MDEVEGWGVAVGVGFGAGHPCGKTGVPWLHPSSLRFCRMFFFSFKAFFETFYTIFAVNSFILFGAVLGPGCCTEAFSSCGARASHVVASLTVDLGLWAHGLQ